MNKHMFIIHEHEEFKRTIMEHKTYCFFRIYPVYGGATPYFGNSAEKRNKVILVSLNAHQKA